MILTKEETGGYKSKSWDMAGYPGSKDNSRMRRKCYQWKGSQKRHEYGSFRAWTLKSSLQSSAIAIIYILILQEIRFREADFTEPALHSLRILELRLKGASAQSRNHSLSWPARFRWARVSCWAYHRSRLIFPSHCLKFTKGLEKRHGIKVMDMRTWRKRGRNQIREWPCCPPLWGLSPSDLSEDLLCRKICEPRPLAISPQLVSARLCLFPDGKKGGSQLKNNPVHYILRN